MTERDANGQITGWKVGPFTVDPRVSLTGIVWMLLAIAAIVGGYYSLQLRVSYLESQQSRRDKQWEQQQQVNEQLKNTLEDTNAFLGRLDQRMNDAHVGSDTGSH